MEESAKVLNSEQRAKEKRRVVIAEFKYSIWSFLHRCFWRVLHFTGLARPYSIFSCWSNTYTKYPDGRCGWCGVKH
jgi:hypothetical protein